MLERQGVLPLYAASNPLLSECIAGPLARWTHSSSAPLTAMSPAAADVSSSAPLDGKALTSNDAMHLEESRSAHKYVNPTPLLPLGAHFLAVPFAPDGGLDCAALIAACRCGLSCRRYFEVVAMTRTALPHRKRCLPYPLVSSREFPPLRPIAVPSSACLPACLHVCVSACLSAVRASPLRQLPPAARRVRASRGRARVGPRGPRVRGLPLRLLRRQPGRQHSRGRAARRLAEKGEWGWGRKGAVHACVRMESPSLAATTFISPLHCTLMHTRHCTALFHAVINR